jgi:hypothetical protein
MKPPLRRLLGVLMICASPALLGCETWKHGLRPNQADSESEKSDDYDRKITRDSHPSGTASGMWSKQAREIEKDFNVR